MKRLETIAATLPDYDPQSLSAAAVGEFLDRLVEPVTQAQSCGVFEALDRVLADDVVSPISVPPHDNSAMDGYAFDSALLRAAQPLVLRCAGAVFAGRAWTGALAAGECLKIMTGAVMPAGADTVVPVELVTVDGERVHIPADVVRPGANRRRRGEDLMAGQAALRRGQVLGPAALGLLASLGLSTVPVLRRLKVAYFSTGDEILSLGEAPREGAVYDSNRYTVSGLLRRLGVDVIDMGVIRDDPAALEIAFREATGQADVVITSGGVSAGDADHTRAMMQRLGDVVFWRIAMRPGRPMAVGRLTVHDRQALLFGLPGNPVAVMVSFLAFVRPALQKMMGMQVRPPLLLPARSQDVLRKRPGRTEYQRGVVSRAADGNLQVQTTGDQGSGVLHSMVEANALIVLHHDQGTVAAGELVDVLLFDCLV